MSKQGPYWGEISRQDLEEILKVAEDDCWQKGLLKFLSLRSDHLLSVLNKEKVVDRFRSRGIAGQLYLLEQQLPTQQKLLPDHLFRKRLAHLPQYFCVRCLPHVCWT